MDRSTEELLRIIQFAESVSAKLHGLTAKQSIIQTVIGQFRASKMLHAHIMMMDADGETLRFAASSFAPRIIKMGEVIAGVTLDTFRISLDQSPLLSRVIHGNETIQVSTTKSLGELLPSGIVPAILRRIHYEGTDDVLTPLQQSGQVIGILSVTAPGLAEHFIPSLKNLAHHIGAAFDVAQAHEERVRAQRRYQDMLENLNEVFYTVNTEGIITYVSPNSLEIGLDGNELVGKPFAEAFESQDVYAAESRFGEYLTGKRTSGTSEFRFRDKDGALRWILISSRIAIEDGRPAGLRGSIVDITDRKQAEEAHRESERILDQTGKMAKIGGWEHNLETGRAVWTDELFKISEIDPAQPPPGPNEHLDFYPPEHRERLAAAYNRAVQEGIPFDLELQVIPATGNRLWGRAYGEPVLENGKCVKMRGTFQDINSRKLAELAHAEGERRLSTLMSNLPGMVYRCRNEPNWTMEFVSEGSRRLTGYAPEDLIEDQVIAYGELIHPQDRDRVWQEIQKAVESNHPFELEYRLLNADGSERWVREQGQALASDDVNIVALEGFISDITDQRSAEEALRTNEKRLTLALEATTDGLWDWNRTTGEIYFSPRCYTMLGYEPYEFAPEYSAWQSAIHPEDRAEALRRMQDHTAERDDSFEIEFRLRAKDDSWRWILNRGRVVERDAKGEPVRLIGTHLDITARKRDAESIKRALDGTIRAIARMAEERDPYTSGHQERVSLLSCAISQEMGELATLGQPLRVAGLLHDIGKIAVPSEILSKPSRLTEPEMRIVQLHPEASYRILEEVEFPWPVIDMVRQHHERLDGSGYARGLKGDEICLGARILAVADVVEAMASHRPYRASLGIDAALAEIEGGKGNLFDADVVDACLCLFRERGLTLETLSPEICSLNIQ